MSWIKNIKKVLPKLTKKSKVVDLKDAPAQMIRRGMIAGPVAKDESPKMIAGARSESPKTEANAEEAKKPSPRRLFKGFGKSKSKAKRATGIVSGKKTFSGSNPFGAIARGIGSSMKKKKEEEDKEPAAFKKGGMVKKGRGMGAATRGGGACAPRKPRKMMGGGMAKAYKKGGSACK